MKFLLAVFITLLIGCVSLFTSCSAKPNNVPPSDTTAENAAINYLKDTLSILISEYPGETGIALITDRNDTLAINNTADYPLMSVFKLHQGVSLCRLFEKTGRSLDTIVTVYRDSMNPDTWSPMLKDYKDKEFKLTVRRLLEYAIQQSDNNASNYLFRNFESVARVDSCIATFTPRESFRLAVTEGEMWSDHSLCHQNRSSPLGAAILLDRLFTDSLLTSPSQDFIKQTLLGCLTGNDRIAAPLLHAEGIRIAHKTGSGYRDENGVLTAHNDVGVILFPDGRHYTLAVFVKDFHGTESEASQEIARISAVVFDALK